MSIELIGKAKKVSTQGDTLAKLLLIIMADYANDDNQSWPSVKTLSEETEKSMETIKRARRKLISLGLIRKADDQSAVEHYRADKRPTVYEITLENAVSKTTPRKDTDTAPPTQGEVSDMTPRQIDGVSYTTSTGCQIRRERGVADDTQTVIDNKLSKPSHNPLAGVNDARETREATTAENKNTIDTWTPDAHSTALADELNADVDAEAAKFRDRVSSSGRIPDDPDADFRAWLRAGAHRGMLSKRKTVRPSDHRYEAVPHRHSMTCEHVLAIMGPQEELYSHERNGFAPSEWMRACQAQADILNRQEQLA